ncbi:MAG: autotransporter domain-containing protein [Parvibaculaceae bacterium]
MGLPRTRARAAVAPFALLSAFLIMPPAAADEWSNPGSGDWFTSTNWEDGSVPADIDDASISNGGTAVVSGPTTASARTFTIAKGRLSVLDGGIVSGLGGYIGVASEGGSVVVAGPGSTWNLTDLLCAGCVGSGTLDIMDGGSVNSGVGWVGAVFGDGTASVAGSGSTWTLSDYLSVGMQGSGTLSITGGGQVTNTDGYIGGRPAVDSGGTGTVVVDGPGSTWLIRGEDLAGGSLYVGYYEFSDATLTISNGGRVLSAYAEIAHANAAGANGRVVVTGPGSHWGIGPFVFGGGGGDLVVGGLGGYIMTDPATLLVEDGGSVGNGHATIARSASAVAEVTVTGAGSLWLSTEGLDVGAEGAATLTIAEGGEVRVKNASGNPGAVSVGIAAGSTGVMNIGARAGTMAMAPGTLNAGSIVFGDGDGRIVFNHTASGYVFSPDLSGGGEIHHHAGTTLLTGDSSAFTGTATVSGGTLTVADALGGSATVTGGRFVVDGTFGGDVAAGTAGTVSGMGTITGSGDFTGGGILAGTQGQSLTIGGDVLMDGTSRVDVALGGAPSDALFDVGGNLTLDGTLGIADLGGFGAGVYRLFDYGGTLTDNGLAIGTLPGGVLADNLEVQTSVDKQVNLVSTAGLTLGFWDGGNSALHDNGVVDGGAGTWSRDGRNWTGVGGTPNGPYQPNPTFAVFQGSGGLVAVDAAPGAIGVAGMQFAADGYRLEGDAVALQGGGGETLIRVGDGSAGGAGMTATIASDLTGASTLVKSDLGTLILTGSNSYAGGTIVKAGSLVGDAGAIRGDIGTAGTVVFDQAANAGFAGNIAGHGGVDGAMIKRGAGDLVLTGTSTLDWTIDAGGLITAADRFGGGGAIGSAGRLAFDQGEDAAYAGVLAGSGIFELKGSGAVTLTGDSSAFAGMTTVAGGNRLIVGTAIGGALGGALTIGAGGLLGGAGTIGSPGTAVTIAAGAVHAPGNSIGAQIVAGDYVNHGTLRVEATPAAADRIVAAGSVDISGAILDLMLSPADAASWDVLNGPFTIIDKQSAGAAVGSFGQVAQNLLFLDALLDYAGGDGNDVTLTLARNDLAFAGAGRTRNQIATGTAIDTLGSADPIWRSIALADDEDVVRASFDALSGEIHASAKAALIEDSRFVRSAAGDRIRAAFGSVGASNDPVVTYGESGPQTSAATTDRFAVWGRAFGSWGHASGDGNAARLERSTGGVFFGADVPMFDTWRFGAVAGYSRTSFDVKDRHSSGRSDNYHAGLYGGARWGDLALRTGIAYTWHGISTSRAVAIPGFDDRLKGGYDAGTAQVFGELGCGVKAGSVAFEPFAGLAYVSLHADGFTEKDGAAALSGAGGSTDATFTMLGLRASATFDLDGASLTATGMFGWRHAFGDVVPEAAMRFGGGDAFTIAGVPVARDAAMIEAGLDYAVSAAASLGVSYGGMFGAGVGDQSFRAGLDLEF